MQYFKKIDRQLLKWVYQRPFKNSFPMKALIFMGDGPFWMIVLFITALTGQLLNSESFRQLSVLLMFGLLISNIVFVFCKTYVKRMRPYANAELHHELHIQIQNRDPGHGSKELESFPSGHVLWTTLCVGLISSQFGFTAVLLFGWMIPTMMYLRLYLGVHYPSDILASLIISSINIAITLLIAPGLMECINDLKKHDGYIYGYWVFIAVFIIIGFKSWLKRV